MTHPRTKDRRSALDALVHEAKRDLTPGLSDEAFASMEERILARMAAEPRPVVDDVRSPGADTRGRVLRIGAAVLAVAAAVALFTKNEPGGPLLDGPAPGMQAELTAGSLRSTEGTGEVRVGGQVASAGHVLRAGDVVEADGARALLERPRKVSWLLEGRTDPVAAGAADARVGRARVKSAGESLVLGLEDGAIEAQVTPVPSGEAFAVDVAAGASLVRVAVHGTHLRVSRSGSRVVVDLTEGVVSIGVPPRTGSTYGTLVTAPSHVEFDATDLDHTLKIEHAPAAVRAPVSLLHQEAPVVAARAAEPAAPAADTSTPVAPSTVPRPVASVHAVDPSRSESAAGDRNGRMAPSTALAPRDAIAAAVRACAAARSRPENVRVTVTSSLELKISAGGDVETARFHPPLLPEIQTCAAAEIYKAKIADAAGGMVTVPIEFSY